MSYKHSAEEKLFDFASYGRPFIREGALWIVHEAMPVLDFHAHDGFQIHFLLTGNMTRELRDGTLQPLHGGTLSLLQPGVLHRGEHGVAHPCREISLVLSPDCKDLESLFPPREASRILRTLRKAGNCVIRAREEQEVVMQQLLTALDEAHARPPAPHRECWIRLLLGQFILCAVRAIVQPKFHPQYYAIAKACRLIQKDEEGRMTSSRIAAELRLSPSRFRDLFQKTIGQTVANYRNSLRCESAARLLAATAKPVTEIAHELGFSNSQYFARAFRRYMGVAPSVYREQAAPHQTTRRP